MPNYDETYKCCVYQNACCVRFFYFLLFIWYFVILSPGKVKKINLVIMELDGVVGSYLTDWLRGSNHVSLRKKKFPPNHLLGESPITLTHKSLFIISLMQ